MMIKNGPNSLIRFLKLIDYITIFVYKLKISTKRAEMGTLIIWIVNHE